MALDEETRARLIEHLGEFYTKCHICEGTRLVLMDVVEAKCVKTPLSNSYAYSGKSELYCPVTCQNCCYTVFFDVLAVVQKPK